MLKLYEEYITVDDLRIRYLVSGDGPPVLLVHGIGEFMEIWKNNIVNLSQQFTVYTLDLPGHGLSEKLKKDFTRDFSINFIARFMEAIDVDRANLIGHSLGGPICMAFVINYPEKANKLILVASGGFTDKVPLSYRLVRLPIVSNILLGPTLLVNKATIRIGLKRQFYDEKTAPKDWVDIVSRHLKMSERKNTIRNIAKSNPANTDIMPRSTNGILSMVKQPTLIVHGRQDRLIPVDYAHIASNLIPGARLQVMEECGHHPQIEKATEFNELVSQFLSPD